MGRWQLIIGERDPLIGVYSEDSSIGNVAHEDVFRGSFVNRLAMQAIEDVYPCLVLRSSFDNPVRAGL